MKSSFLLLSCLMAWVSPLAAGTPADVAWDTRSHQKAEAFIIQSHRGAGDLSTDNTFEAFELGWKLKTYPETDVRTTKDGVIVGFHDSNFKRVVKDIDPALRDKPIKELAWDQIKDFDIGSWKGPEYAGQKIPKLSQIFAHMKGHPERHLYMDIKDVDLKQLAKEVSEAGVGPQVILASRHHEVILEWKSLVPDSETLVWIPGTEKEKRETFEKLRATDFKGITQVQIHVNLAGDKQAKDVQPGEPFTPSLAFLREVGRELGKRGITFQTLPWRGGTPEVYRQLLEVGCTAFATDHPEVTLQSVADFYQSKK